MPFSGWGHAPGGFRASWRALSGLEETLDNKHLARAWQAVSAAAFTVMRKQIAFRFCIVRPGSVSMSSREEYLARTDIREGVFLILVSRADPNEHSGEPRPRQSLPADL